MRSRFIRPKNLFYSTNRIVFRAYLLPRESAGGFIDKIIPTLYGDAFAAREEYLLLNLFHHAILKEVKHSTRPNELIQSESIIPGMVLAYSKRKQGNHARLLLALIMFRKNITNLSQVKTHFLF
jgi:hypothetical protein